MVPGRDGEAINGVAGMPNGLAPLVLNVVTAAPPDAGDPRGNCWETTKAEGATCGIASALTTDVPAAPAEGGGACAAKAV